MTTVFIAFHREDMHDGEADLSKWEVFGVFADRFAARSAVDRWAKDKVYIAETKVEEWEVV